MVWVRVPLVQVVQEAYQIYLPVEYLAEVEVVLEAVDILVDLVVDILVVPEEAALE